MSVPPDSLRDRYRSGWADRQVVLFGVAVGVGTLIAVTAAALFFVTLLGYWLLVVVPQQSDPPVSSELVGFEIVDDHTVTAVVRVQWGDEPVPATCTVRAMAVDKTVVGQRSFVPEPDAGPDHEVEIATERRATAVENVGCTAQEQLRPR